MRDVGFILAGIAIAVVVAWTTRESSERRVIRETLRTEMAKELRRTR